MAPQLGGSSAESFGGLLLRFSEVDPDVEQWAREVNQSRGREKTAAPHNGGADGATVAGKSSQINAVDVMEVYSPPRVTVEAKKFGLKAGEALDLVTGYDFGKVADRERVWEIINRDKPALVVGSPECRMFSALQNLSSWDRNKAKKLDIARKHLAFVCEIYEHQVKNSRWFLHEHPSTATSWRERCVLGVMKMENVSTTITDQCMFGLKTRGPDRRPTAAMKKTRFMSNAEEILLAISKKCDGKHTHQQLVDGRAGPAAIYPPALCKAICKGLEKQLQLRRSNLKSLLSLKKGDKLYEAPEQEENLEEMQKAWDDVSGKELDSKGVKEARIKEMTYIHDKQVWVKCQSRLHLQRVAKWWEVDGLM